MRRILFLILMLSSVSSWAEEYYWEWSTGDHPRFTAVKDLADWLLDYLNEPGTVVYHLESLEPLSPSRFRATYVYYNSSGNRRINPQEFARRGDHCPNPETQTYNPETGTCESDNPCEEKQGQEEPLFKSGKGPDAFVSWRSSDGMFFVTETMGCNSQCRVQIHDTRCKGNTSGDYWCWMTGVYTGERCGPGGGEGEGGSDPDLSHPDSQWSEPTITDDYKPCIYVVNADGSKSCTSEQKIESEGRSCGVANGVVVCSSNSAPPKKEDLTIETTITETTRPDGSTETTKTDRADYVTCVGIRCETSTTTSTTTTTTDAAGNNTGSSSTCTGPLCGDKTGAPGADGEGLTTCLVNCGPGNGNGEGGGDGEGEGGQPHDWYVPGETTFSDVLNEFNQRVSAAPIIAESAQFFDLRVTGSCPVWSVNAWVFQIIIDQHCSPNIPWDLIRGVLLACASFVAFRWAFL